MQDYIIITDSGSDLSAHTLSELGIPSVSLNCFMKDEPAKAVTLHGKAFYDELRAGKIACTSAANLSAFRAAFSKALQDGKDVLYLAFSSALSCMYATANIAAEELSEEYPDRTIRVIDTRCASLGLGLLVRLAAAEKAKGVSLDALAAYIENKKYAMMHWFTVDDLMYLKRGGRLSAVSAFAGTLLGIKPVLTVSREGRLTGAEKQRGRKNAILALAKHYAAECADRTLPVAIAQADAQESAGQLRDILMQEYGAQQVTIGELGPVIGAHTGPGLIALFFVGRDTG